MNDILSHLICIFDTCFKLYIKAFQYKVPNSILFTNTKLFKIGYISKDKCLFCKLEPETPHHLLFHCSLVQPFLPSNKRIRPSYPARCHDWHYLCKLLFTELFDTGRQIIYMGLQKKSDSSYYKRL